MNLCLQSTLFTAVPEDNLSSYYRRLSSVAALPSHPSSLSSFPPLPLHAGDVLEVHGCSQSGKSAVLLSCVLSCCLPSVVLGLSLHGCDRSCVLIDCDGRLSVYRLQCMLEERCSKAWQQHWETVASSSSASPAAADELRVAASRSRRQAVALLTQLLLRRLRLVHAADEVQLMAALLAVDRICEAEQGRPSEQGTNEQQRQQQLLNIAPYLHNRQRPLFHTRDEDGQQPDEAPLSHGRSIANLPLPQHSTLSHTALSSPLSLVSRYSPVSPLHSLSLHSPDPLMQASQSAHSAPPPSSAAAAAAAGAGPLPSAAALSSSAASVAEVLSALSSLCGSSPPPVELLLVDNVAAFYFAAKNADRLSAVSASSPASGPSAPTVYASISTRLRRLLVDRQLAAVVSKPTLFASTATSLQADWKHSEYLPPDYASLVRWRLLLRMKPDGSSMMDDDDNDDEAASTRRRARPGSSEGLDEDDSGGLRECRLLRCKEEEVNGLRQGKNTVSFHSTFAHNKEGVVFV